MCILGQLIYLFSKNNDTESMLEQLSKEEREVCATEAVALFFRLISSDITSISWR